MNTAVIICRLDGFANSVKPAQLVEHLGNRGYRVDVYSSERLSRVGVSGFQRLLPKPGWTNLRLYLLEALQALAARTHNQRVRRVITSLTELRIRRLRGRLLGNALPRSSYDVLICESNYDVALTLNRRVARVQILDLPVPLAEELFYGAAIHRRAFKALSRFEARAYAEADAISFHWHTYNHFVEKTKYAGDNFVDLSYGTTPKTACASFAHPLRIVFLGNLGGYWVDLALLERLTRLYPDIDVYGGPEPPAGSRINYRGYAPTLDVLADYQLGLVTITDDPLRRNSFSSKQLEYFSYGLPVLTPAWRPDPKLASGSIPFTESSFLAALHSVSTPEAWQLRSSAALSVASSLEWPSVLTAFDPLLARGLS